MPNNSVEDIGASRAESSRWAFAGEGETNGIKVMQRVRKRREYQGDRRSQVRRSHHKEDRVLGLCRRCRRSGRVSFSVAWSAAARRLQTTETLGTQRKTPIMTHAQVKCRCLPDDTNGNHIRSDTENGNHRGRLTRIIFTCRAIEIPN
jgi:hypothetical protein